MRKIITTFAVGGLSALMALTSIAPVQAMPIQAPAGIQQTENPVANVESVEWRHNRHHWKRHHSYRHDRRHYDRRYYGHRRHHHSNGAAIIGGLAAGAIIGGAIANSNNHRYYYHNGRRYLRD